MAVITIGNLRNIAFNPKAGSKAKSIKGTVLSFPARINLDTIKSIPDDIQIPSLDLAESENKWGLYLKKIKLNEDFEGIFDTKNELYILGVCWDYSGKNPIVFPPVKTDANKFLIPIKEGKTREFIGDGVQLWPSQKVKGGLNVLLFVYECDQDVRDLGKVLQNIHSTVSSSELSALILAVSVNPVLATVMAVEKAVSELVNVVGKIMEKNEDDYVDLFMGTYGTDKPQTSSVKKYTSDAVDIELEFVIS